LTKLQQEGYGTKFVVDAAELDLGTTPATLEELAMPGNRSKVRIDQLLRYAAAAAATAAATTASDDDDRNATTTKEIRLRFLQCPTSFRPSATDSQHVGAVVCEQTQLAGPAGQQVAVVKQTGKREETTTVLQANLVLVSIDG